MKSATVHRDMIEHGDREFPVEHTPCDWKDPIVKILPDKRAVVGYLCHDDDVDNPLEDCDGMGKILRGYRDAGQTERNEFLEAIGRNQYGEKEGTAHPYAVTLDVYIHSGEAWRVHGGGVSFPDEQWDVSNCAGVWVPDEACMEHIEMVAAKAIGINIIHKSVTRKSRKAGRKETKYTSRYRWEICDAELAARLVRTMPNIPLANGWYDTVLNTVLAAVKGSHRRWHEIEPVFTRHALEEAEKCAKSAVETYNEWISGDCYGYVVEVFDQEDEQIDEADACWGLIGGDYAEKTLETEVESTFQKLLKAK